MDLSAVGKSLPEIEKSPKKVCAVCQAPADKACSACHQIDYCSVEHQKSHWRMHKKACSPIRIVSSPELGPHFVATRDLPPWTLLLTELPVLVLPFSNSKDDPISCISCRSMLTVPWPCSRCSIPFCNLSCSMHKFHSKFECGVLSKCSEEQRLKVTPNIGVLRAINLKNSDPQTWNKVLELRGADQYKPADTGVNNDWFIREILPLLGEKGVGFEADMASLEGIYAQRGIMVHDKGIFTSLSPKGCYHNGETQLLYLKTSNFVQNCFPNCTKIIGKGPEFKLEIRTTVDVKKGSIPSINYMGLACWRGAMTRQHILHGIKGALCICPRCTDPTGSELGSMLSAVKCTQPDCNDGYLLPIDPMDMGENATWRCNRSGCKGEGSTWAEIEKLTSKLKHDIDIFEERVPLADFKRTSEFLKSLKKKLHPNHDIVLQFETWSARVFNVEMIYEKMKFSPSRMDLHISMIEHLLKMIEMVEPGLSRNRCFLTLLFNGLNHKLLWKQADQRAVQREVMKRAIEVIDLIQSIVKFYPDINWNPLNFHYQTERRRMFQMALNSTN